MVIILLKGIARRFSGWKLGVCLCLVLAPLQVWALTPEEVMARVQAQYDKSQGFKTWFRQESRLRGASQGEKAEGWMYFQKPYRMRWQYENPPEHKKELVSDGRQVWLYLPQDNLVMVYPLSQVLKSDLVLRFFSGMGQFRQEFIMSWRRPPEESLSYQVDLYPRKTQAELKRLTLTINPNTYLVEQLEFANALGEETRFSFARQQMEVKLAADYFTFTPPPGVQIVRDAPGR
jgi:outer membrane lipoprotein carrier protein